MTIVAKNSKSFLQLKDISPEEYDAIFRIADHMENYEKKQSLSGKTIVLFFPESSIRTRVTFEKGRYQRCGRIFGTICGCHCGAT